MANKKSKSPVNKTIYDDIFPRRLSKSDQRRLEILEGAIQAYSELDFNSISFDEIAVPSKLSRRLVQHYFPDKEVLFETTMKLIRAKFQELAVQSLSKEHTAEGQFREYVRSTFYWIRLQPSQVRAWFLFFLVCSQKSKYRKIHAELTAIGENRIAALINNFDLKIKLTSEEGHYIAKSVQRLITGGILEVCSEQSIESLEQIQEEVLKTCLSLIAPYR